MRNINFGGLLVLAASLLAGCQTAHEGVGVQAVQPPQPITLQRDESLSQAVQEEFHSKGAVVLLDERHNAYVGLPARPEEFKRVYVKAPYETRHSSQIKSAGEIPAPVQEQIASLLRGKDQHVATVYVTADSQQIKELLQFSSGGARIQAVEQSSAAAVAKEIWSDDQAE